MDEKKSRPIEHAGLLSQVLHLCWAQHYVLEIRDYAGSGISSRIDNVQRYSINEVVSGTWLKYIISHMSPVTFSEDMFSPGVVKWHSLISDVFTYFTLGLFTLCQGLFTFLSEVYSHFAIGLITFCRIFHR